MKPIVLQHDLSGYAFCKVGVKRETSITIVRMVARSVIPILRAIPARLRVHLLSRLSGMPWPNYSDIRSRLWSPDTITHLVTSGFVEAKSNKIRLVKRIAFGLRSFTHFRARIQHGYSGLVIDHSIPQRTKKR